LTLPSLSDYSINKQLKMEIGTIFNSTYSFPFVFGKPTILFFIFLAFKKVSFWSTILYLYILNTKNIFHIVFLKLQIVVKITGVYCKKSRVTLEDDA